jgi:hypothetical protein
VVRNHRQRSNMRASKQYIADAATMRATGIVALLAIGTIHFVQIVPTLQETPLLGLGYLALIIASVTVAAWLIIANDARAWAAAGLLSAAVLVGYAFTRLVGTVFDNQDVGNWACALGLASLFIEAALVSISGYAIASLHSELRLENATRDRHEQAIWKRSEPRAVTLSGIAAESPMITTRPSESRSFISDLHAVRHVANRQEQTTQ